MIIVHAELADVPRLLRFRRDAAAWLAKTGTDQWSNPFPTSIIVASVKAREVFLVKETPTSDPAATITLDRNADPALWSLKERQEPAFYVHKLAVDRWYAGIGLGARLLDWAGDRAARSGAIWLRLDAWTTNTRLHDYYLHRGFQHVRTCPDPGEVSGWLAQRRARRNAHGFDDRTERNNEEPMAS